MLQVSRQTLYTRLEQFGINLDKFTPISEQDLNTALIDIKNLIHHVVK